MKIAWNKVTWYSKLIALALFVALPFIGFWFGTQYGETVAPLYTSTALSTPTIPYYTNTNEWQTDTRLDGGFSIAYPIDFSFDDDHSSAPMTDWRLGAGNDTGLKMFTLTIPASFEPQTNFADGTLTVGRSNNSTAVANCLKSDEPETSASTTLNGVPFTVFKSSSVGAGNTYETTSYRTVHSGQCYAIEYTIHSSQIANYPSQYGLQPFNETEVASLLDRIANTFRFN